ncbi:MAG: hypothetical protein NVS3B21_01100 [Acidimicrobiales bacterium]
MIVIVLVGAVVGPRDAQGASREALTLAIVDHHSLSVDRERAFLSVDYAVRDGHYYSDKAPLQPLLAVPAYASYRLFLPAPSPKEPERDLALWWLTLWTSTVPAGALAVMMRRAAARNHPQTASWASLALSVGTLLLAFSGMLFGHLLAAFFLFAGWMFVSNVGPRPPWALFTGGLLVGCAVATEYPVAAAVAVLTVLVVVKERSRARMFLAGGVLPAVLLMSYQATAFGGPFHVSYRSSTFTRHQHGLVGIGWPQLPVLWRATFGDRGVLVVTPVIVVALVGAAMLARSRATRRDGLLPVGLLVMFLIMQAGVDAYGGSSPGPRYIVPILPFLSIPLAAAWRRMPLLGLMAMLIGAFVMLLALYTNPYPILRVNGLGVWINLARSHRWAHTVFALDVRSGWPPVAMAGSATVLALLLYRRPLPADTRRETPNTGAAIS